MIFARSNMNRLQTAVVQHILFAYQQHRNAVSLCVAAKWIPAGKYGLKAVELRHIKQGEGTLF
jgi:hypothetical protein